MTTPDLAAITAQLENSRDAMADAAARLETGTRVLNNLRALRQAWLDQARHLDAENEAISAFTYRTCAEELRSAVVLATTEPREDQPCP
jgi:hypothetical protein